MDRTIWSSRFARQTAETLGYSPPGTHPGADQIAFGPEAEQISSELTETFRYLPLERIQWVLDFAQFLRSSAPAAIGVPAKFREALHFALFLRERYGAAQPADENDSWTEEDEQDLTRETWRRLDAEDPWPEEDVYPS